MIGGDFDVPIMYQDLANSTMSPMNIPFGMMPGMYGVGMYGGGMANTSYLGGVQMRQQPDRDKVEILNKKENSDKNIYKIKYVKSLFFPFCLKFIMLSWRWKRY